ncbi:hypothetical protein CKO41_17270 [Thiococcus pfennigii]|nr:hypothetical protein [Thiococcus pfennigii]
MRSDDMTSPRSLHPAPLAALAIALLVTPLMAGAQSACKGLEQPACTAQANCTWVGGYTRSSGAQVAGYCRSKGNRSTKTTTDAPPAVTVSTDGQ